MARWLDRQTHPLRKSEEGLWSCTIFLRPASIFLSVCLDKPRKASWPQFPRLKGGQWHQPHRCGEDDSGNPCRARSTVLTMETCFRHGGDFCTFSQGLGLPTKLPSYVCPCPLLVSPSLWALWPVITRALLDLSSSQGPEPGSLSLLSPQ